MEEPRQIVKPDHITYREYKKRLSKKPLQSFVLFVSAFFILLLAFLGIAKLMSPDVDISIGDEPEITSEQEGVYRSNVDNRLKKIQDEDNGIGAVDNTFAPELDEKVKIPDKKQESEPLKVQEEAPIVLEQKAADTVKNQEKAKIEQPLNTVNQPKVDNTQNATSAPAPQPTQAPVPVASTKVYKVYVGHYASSAQAEVAKGIITETNMGVNPFVKNVNGAYTLQAGSFSSAEKAQAAANDLLRNNFPARVVAE